MGPAILYTIGSQRSSLERTRFPRKRELISDQRTIWKLKTGFWNAPNNRSHIEEHLRAPGCCDVSKVDDVGPAEAPEQLGHRCLCLRVVAANEHRVVGTGELLGIDHEVGVHGMQGLDNLSLRKPRLDLLTQRVGVRHREHGGHAL